MVLEVAIGEPRGDAPRECRHEILDLQDLHLALHLHSRREPQPDGGDHAEQPVPADRESKQLGVLLATAGAGDPVGVDQHERLDVPDEGLEQQAAAVRRSEEHTSELQSPCNLVCRLLLEKKKKKKQALFYICTCKMAECIRADIT